MNENEDDSLGRRTLVATLAMLGGAVGVVGLLSVVTLLVIGRAVGPLDATPDGAGATSERQGTVPATAGPKASTPSRALAQPAMGTDGTEI